jgi:hypothetical protein
METKMKLTTTLTVIALATAIMLPGASTSAGEFPTLAGGGGPIGLPDKPIVRPSSDGPWLPPDKPVSRPDKPAVKGDIKVTTGPLELVPEVFCGRDGTDHPGWFVIINTSDEILPAGTVYHYIFLPSGLEGTIVLAVDLDPNHAWSTGDLIIPKQEASNWECELTQI